MGEEAGEEAETMASEISSQRLSCPDIRAFALGRSLWKTMAATSDLRCDKWGLMKVSNELCLGGRGGTRVGVDVE